MTALLVDVGNTRIKWRCGEREGACATADAATLVTEWRDLAATAAWLSNVAGTAVGAVLDRALSGTERHWVVPQSLWHDYHCAYGEPRQLGPDRWLAGLAAWREQRHAALVVSVGTALTVDAISGDGWFLGGIIAPGMSLMRQALATGTARLDAPTGMVQDFPRNTPDAIHSGIIAALSGAVHQQYAKLMADGAAPILYLCGGGAPDLAPHLGLPVVHRPDLVLTGLALLAEE